MEAAMVEVQQDRAGWLVLDQILSSTGAEENNS